MPRLREPIKKIADTATNLINDLLFDPDEAKMAFFSALLDEFREIVSVYETLLPEFISKTREATARVTYSQAGDCVHRGIMCPSPVLDLMVGCNRGKVIDSPEDATENFFKYSFDAKGNLIAVCHYFIKESREIPDEAEFIFREGNVEYAITYHMSWREITRIAKVGLRADGDPEYYAASDYDSSDPDLMFLHYEEYQYKDDVPVRADVYFGISPELNMYEHHTFHVTMEPGSKEDKLSYPRHSAEAILREA